MIDLPTDDREAVLSIDKYLADTHQWHFTKEQADHVVKELAELSHSRFEVAVAAAHLFFSYIVHQNKTQKTPYIPPKAISDFYPLDKNIRGSIIRIHLLGEDAYKGHEWIPENIASRSYGQETRSNLGFKKYHCALCERVIKGEKEHE